jgi:hypothetical protein
VPSGRNAGWSRVAGAVQGGQLAELFCTQAAGATTPAAGAVRPRRHDRLRRRSAPVDGRYDWFTADVLDPAGAGPMMP